MLLAKPNGWLSRSYAILRNGQPVAEVQQGWWREGGHFRADGETHTVRRQGLRGPFLLERDGRVVAQAVRPSAWRNEIEIALDGRRLLLRRPSAWSRGTALLEGGRQMGTVRPTSWLTNRAEIDLPDELPLPVQVFVFFLVLLQWCHDAAAASAMAIVSS